MKEFIIGKETSLKVSFRDAKTRTTDTKKKKKMEEDSNLWGHVSLINCLFWAGLPANICWSSRRLEDVFKACLQDVFKTSSVLQFFVFQDVLKTSWKRLARQKIVMLKTSSRTCLKDILKTCLKNILKKCPKDVFKMSSRCLKDFFKPCLEDLLETNKMFTGNIYI